jgi:hypothetical protein
MRRALVAALFLAYVAGFAWSLSIPDTSRDAFIAYGIRHGLSYPVEGPFLGIPSAVHLGPLWYYLVAIPLWVSDTWLAFALFQGVLCGLKFVLAWHCGRKLVSERFGLLWAAALALPGWTTMEVLIPFNASVAETASLLILAAYLHCRDHPDSRGAIFMLGLAIGAALHAHPTTAPFAVMGLFAVHRSWKMGVRPISQFFVLVAGALVLFAPYVASQAINGWPDWSSARGYVASQLSISQLLLVPQLLFAQLYSGPRFVVEDFAGWPHGLAAALGAVCVALTVIACVATLLRSERTDIRILAAFAGVTLALVPWLLLLRPTTPFYFLNVLAPATAGVVAMGAETIAKWVPRFRFDVASAGSLIVLQVIVLVGIARNVEQGGSGTSAQALDVKDFRGTQSFADIWFPAAGRRVLGNILCRSRPVTLHGALAFVEDRSVGMDGWFECASSEFVALGGSAGSRHLVGLTHREWRMLDIEPPCAAGSLGIVSTSGPFWPEGGVPIAEGSRYFPRVVATGSGKEITARLATSGAGFIVVSNILYGYERLDAISVFHGDKEVKPIFADAISRAYAAGPGDMSVEWRFVARATSRAAVDIAFIPVGAAAAHAC